MSSRPLLSSRQVGGALSLVWGVCTAVCPYQTSLFWGRLVFVVYERHLGRLFRPVGSSSTSACPCNLTEGSLLGVGVSMQHARCCLAALPSRVVNSPVVEKITAVTNNSSLDRGRVLSSLAPDSFSQSDPVCRTKRWQATLSLVHFRYVYHNQRCTVRQKVSIER